MIKKAFLNGEILPYTAAQLHISDLGLLRGYGVFDFFRVIDGRPIFLDDHLDRFEASTAALGLTLPFSRETLTAAVHTLAHENAAPLLGIKMVATGGYALDGYTPTQPNVFMLSDTFTFKSFDNGLKLLSIEHQRDMATVKTLNYAFPIQHLPQLKAGGFDDFLYHKNGFVSESSRSNIFIVKNKKVWTPQAGVLLGVTRRHMAELAQQIGNFEEAPLSIADVLAADEVFITGSTKRVVPVTQIDGHSYPIGEVTRALYDLLIEREKR